MQVWALMRCGEPEPIELYARRAEAEAALERVRGNNANLAELLSVEPFELDETAPASPN